MSPGVDWPDDFIDQTTYPTNPSPLPLPFGLGSAVHEGAQEALEDGLTELGDGNQDGSLNSDDWKSAAQAALQALLKRLWKDWAYPPVRRELEDAFCWADELEWYEFLYPTTWWRAFVSFFVDFYWNPVIREAGGAAALGYVWYMYDRYEQRKVLKLKIRPCELECDPEDSDNRWYFAFEFEFDF